MRHCLVNMNDFKLRNVILIVLFGMLSMHCQSYPQAVSDADHAATQLTSLSAARDESEAGVSGSPHSDFDLVSFAGFKGYKAVEFQANSFTAGVQENVAVDVTTSGNIIAVWESQRQNGEGYGIYFRLFDPTGRSLSEEVRVSSHNPGMQRFPIVAADHSNGFWIAWSSFNLNGQGWRIMASRFNQDLGSSIPAIEIPADEGGQQSFPSIALNQAGDAFLAWIEARPGQNPFLRTALITHSGTLYTHNNSLPLKKEIWCDRTPSVSWVCCSDPVERGHFIVTWARANLDEQTSTIVARRFSAQGVAEDTFVPVSDSASENAIEPAIACNSKGQCVIAWMSSGEYGYGLSARWFDQKLHPLKAPFRHEAGKNESFSGVSVALSDTGRATIGYNQVNDDSEEYDIRALIVENNELLPQIVEGPVRLTRATQGRQRLAIARGSQRLIMDKYQRLVVGWSGEAKLGDNHGANVTVIGPQSKNALKIAQRQPVQEDGREIGRHQPAELTARPHLPPVFNPEWKPLPRLKHLRNDGPDYGFEAVSGTGWTPPDPEIAVGPAHLVVIVNGQIAFFSKSGEHLYSQAIEDSYGFWGEVGATNFVFDPEVLYDPHAQRFWAMANERSNDAKSTFLLAVSDDDNPVGTWHKWRFDVTSLAANNIDSPNMAVNSEAVFLTADFFSPDRYLIYILDKAALLSGGLIKAKSLMITGQQSLGLPINYDASAAVQYLIESTELTTNTLVRFHALRNVLTQPTRVTYDLTVPSYRYPGQPTQLGTTYRPYLFEPRFWSCQYINGSLWAIHHIRRVGESDTIVRWYQFALNGWPASGQYPTIEQWGDIEAGPETHCYFPSICADEQGNAAITFSRSSSTEYISMWRALRHHTDPPGTFQSMVLVKQSQGPSYTDRWGDYSGTKMDPVESYIFWGHNEWEDVSSNWRTWVARYDNSPEQVPTLTISGILVLMLLLSLSIYVHTQRRKPSLLPRQKSERDQ